jgi:hypothetical protein
MRESARGLVGVCVFWLLALGGVVGLGLIIQHAPGIKPAHAQPTNLGPNVYFYTAVTTAQQIIGTNPTRHGLQICNDGGTNVLWIMPNVATVNTGALVNPAANVGISVLAVASNVVSCFSPPTNAPSIGQAWNGFSTTTPVTILEYP